jgi:hypothetical protein
MSWSVEFTLSRYGLLYYDDTRAETESLTHKNLINMMKGERERLRSKLATGLKDLYDCFSP